MTTTIRTRKRMERRAAARAARAARKKVAARKAAEAKIMRRNNRAVKKAVRDVEREQTTLEREQKKLVANIKKLAKQQDQNDAVEIMAKDLVRNRRSCTKMIKIRSQMLGVQRRMRAQARGLRTTPMPPLPPLHTVSALVESGNHDEALDILYLAIHAVERISSSGPHNYSID